MEQAEVLIDVMTQSESTQVVESLEEAEELTSMKIEIMQTVKQHDITKRQLRSRASSRSSIHSHLSTASKAEGRKENRIKDNQHNTRAPFGHTFDAAQNQERIEDQLNNFVNSTNSVLYELRNRNIQRVVSRNEEKQNMDQNPTEPDKTSQLDQPGVSDAFQLQGSGDYDISKENQKSLVSSHQITTPTSQYHPFDAYRKANEANFEPSYYQSIFHADQQQKNHSPLRQEDPNRQLDKNVDNRPNMIISLDHSPTSSAMPKTTNEASVPLNNSPSLQLTENCVRDANSLLLNQQNTIRNSENEIVNINTDSYHAFSNTNLIRTIQVESNNEMPAPPLTTNRPYFIGSEETGNMNPTNTSPLSKNRYLKRDRTYIAQANGSTAATEIFSVPAETKKASIRTTSNMLPLEPWHIDKMFSPITSKTQRSVVNTFITKLTLEEIPKTPQNNKVTTLHSNQPSMVTTRIQENIRTTITTINTSPSFEITTARSSSQTFA